MFWGGLTLLDRLATLVRYEDKRVVSKKMIDCSAITLSLGSEVYITPSGVTPKKEKTILTEENPQFTIPKGQFAFLITEEFVTVPIEAMAFISFKAKYKFKGLINVSGFHVDPGWDGRLIFSVFNAGPQDVTFEKGDPFALIWYADLDIGQNDFSKRNTKLDSISSDMMNNMSGEVFSPFKLREEIEEIKERVSASEYRAKAWFIGTASTLFLSILWFTFRSNIAGVIKSLFGIS